MQSAVHSNRRKSAYTKLSVWIYFPQGSVLPSVSRKELYMHVLSFSSTHALLDCEEVLITRMNVQTLCINANQSVTKRFSQLILHKEKKHSIENKQNKKGPEKLINQPKR